VTPGAVTANEWEEAWAEHVDALDWYDHVPPGEDWVFDISRAAMRLKDAASRLRSIDRDFCERLGI
jgi:hypothetical protein